MNQSFLFFFLFLSSLPLLLQFSNCFFDEFVSFFLKVDVGVKKLFGLRFVYPPLWEFTFPFSLFTHHLYLFTLHFLFKQQKDRYPPFEITFLKAELPFSVSFLLQISSLFQPLLVYPPVLVLYPLPLGVYIPVLPFYPPPLPIYPPLLI